jgi:hypothetical protein
MPLSRALMRGNRCEQLCWAMSVRQRLEALDKLTRLSGRPQAMRSKTGRAFDKNERFNTYE